MNQGVRVIPQYFKVDVRTEVCDENICLLYVYQGFLYILHVSVYS